MPQLILWELEPKKSQNNKLKNIDEYKKNNTNWIGFWSG